MSRPYPFAELASWLKSMTFAEAWFPMTNVVPELTVVGLSTPALIDPSKSSNPSIIMIVSPFF
jgi:hypothetical protein